jgi:hypothetical protein
MQVSKDPAAHVQCGGGLLQQAYTPACLYSPGTFWKPCPFCSALQPWLHHALVSHATCVCFMQAV